MLDAAVDRAYSGGNRSLIPFQADHPFPVDADHFCMDASRMARTGFGAKVFVILAVTVVAAYVTARLL